MIHRCFSTFVISHALFTSMLAFGQEPPTLPAVLPEEKVFEKKVAKAKADYDTVVKRARDELKTELEKSKVEATKAGDLEKAIAIRDRLEKISDEPRIETPASKLSAKDLAGKKFMFSTLKDNMIVTLEADGRITGHNHPNESTWKVTQDGKLLYYSQDGKLTWVWDQVRFGQKKLYIEGGYIDTSTGRRALREMP